MKNNIKKMNCKSSMYIKASCNEFYLGEEIQLVALKESLYEIEEIQSVKWEINYSGDDILLRNNLIIIKPTLKNIEYLEVSCEDKSTGARASRKFPIISEERKETLVHFIKNDGNYFGNGYKWDLWTFSEDGVSCNVQLNDKSDFGRCAFVKERNVIARRRSWGDRWGNDWSEQTITFKIPENAKNCYIVYGENKLLTDLNEVIDYIKPRIEIAIMDDNKSIVAFLSKEPLDIIEFYLYINGVKQEEVKYKIDKELKKVEFFNLNLEVSPKDLIEIRASHTYLPCKVVMRGYLDKFYYEKDDMGVSFSKNTIKLRVWAPTAVKIDLCIYDKWYEREEKSKYGMEYDFKSGTFNIEINREKNEGKFYLYKLYFRELDRSGKEYIKVNYAVDPYAFSVGINGDKGCLIDLNKSITMPDGWLLDKRPELLRKEDSIIYEVHLRDFTISEDSGINKNLRGKYLALTKEGRVYTDKKSNVSIKTGIDHLKELGITHLQILPIFDFGSVDERKANKKGNRSWGYDPKNYNVPDGCYSSDPYSPITRIIELRSMIKALHKNNIRVVMDVVYNHMQDTRNLDNIVPWYYFRSNYRGRYTNGSGCGNEIATERPMVRKYIIDSIKHWLNDYHIDGFRFDLMGLIDIDTMKEVVKVTTEIDDNILVYGEPWKGGDSTLINGICKGMQRGEGFSVFNDTFRDYIRGNNSPSNGFVNGNQHDGPTAWSIIEGLKGSINTLATKPIESINYVDVHDNYTLWDQIEKSLNKSIKPNEYRIIEDEDILDNHLVRRNILALAIILLSQGIPLIHGGAEILRTKNGDNNSYKSPDYINEINWIDKVKYYKVFNFIKTLVKIRKRFNVFRCEDKDQLKNTEIYFLNGDEKAGVIKWHYRNTEMQDGIKELIVVFNGTSIDNYDINEYLNTAISDEWNLIAINKLIDENGLKKVKRNEVPTLNAYSLLIMYA
ncbi:type I pullulanase [Clostridium sp. AL.422]|uniref:type I pullulanase n=1 Tax=Clostridium TaxID=1485 RepID=UPI00293DC0CD|nr:MULTISPECIES: type I pullulanase [unclassified Clostridium]MDV4152565.1 type I pullulanase [Clostridium sp. AL.422]